MTQTLAKIDNPITWTVQYKSSWGDAWSTADPHLVPTEVQFALAPTVPRATIIRNFGDVSRLGVGESVVEPLDLTGKFIKIRLSQIDSDGATDDKDWYGYCPDPTDLYEGTRHEDKYDADVSTGLTTYNCYGLEWFLRDSIVNLCIMKEPGEGTRGIENNRVIPFNFTDGDRYGKVKGNRSTDKSNGIYEFSPDTDEEWTGEDVVEHLLEAWYLQSGEIFRFELQYVGHAAELQNIEGSWNFDGVNFYQAIFSIIGPSNAFSFRVTVDEDESPDVAKILVYPTVSSDVVDEASDVIVTALENKYVLNLDTDSQIAKNGASIQYLSANHFDEIEVRGDWLRTAFTLATGDRETTVYGWPRVLKEGWDSVDKAAYDAADDDGRRTEDNGSVYRRFVVDEDWDGMTSQTSLTDAIPRIDTDTGKVNTTVQQNFFMKNRVFGRTLPWNDIDNESQPRAPFAFWFDETGKWNMIDNPAGDYTGLGLAMLDDELGVKIVTGSNLGHIAAKNEFEDDSDKDPEWDYNDMFVTVSLQTDERARVIVSAPDAEPGQVKRTKVINMPQLAVWWICPNTVKSIDPSQTDLNGLVLSESAGEYSRDDSDKLLRAAILAKELYGRKRQVLNITYDSPFIDDMVGSFVEEVQAGQTTEPVETIISDITYRLQRNQQQLILKTSFFEFDLNKIFGRRGSSSSMISGNPFGKPNFDELANIPSRQPSVSVSVDSFISVSYDPDSEEFSISSDGLPFYTDKNSVGVFADSAGDIKLYSSDNLGWGSEPLVFDKPSSSYRTLYLAIESGYQRGLGGVYRMTWRGSSVTPSNGYTEGMINRDDQRIGIIQEINIHSDGTHEIINPQIAPVLIFAGTNTRSPMLYWSSDRVYLVDYMSQSDGTDPYTQFASAPAGTDDSVILGISFTDQASNPILDLGANSGDYDKYAVIGKIKVETIDGGTVATKCFLFMSQTPEMGKDDAMVISEYRDNSGTKQEREKTVYFGNGRYLGHENSLWTNI